MNGGIYSRELVGGWKKTKTKTTQMQITKMRKKKWENRKKEYANGMTGDLLLLYEALSSREAIFPTTVKSGKGSENVHNKAKMQAGVSIVRQCLP